MKADFFQQENLDLCSFLIQLVSICSWRMFATLATRSGKCSAVMVPASGPGLQPGVIAKPGALKCLMLPVLLPASEGYTVKKQIVALSPFCENH